MLETHSPHLNDFTLLRYAAFDLEEIERQKVANHVEFCSICRATLGEIEELNQELSAAAKDPGARLYWEADDLPEGDPFRRRPAAATGPSHRSGDPSEFAARAVAASETGSQLAITILEAARTSAQELESQFATLDLSGGAYRFGLLYALQRAGTGIAECPARFMLFGERSLTLLRVSSDKRTAENELVPDIALYAQAQQLIGQACLWTGDLERASSCFSIAYRFFGQLGDELALAKLEQLESQRRFFSGNGKEALSLAARARTTTQRLGVEDEEARAVVAEGMALFALSRWTESVQAFRQALPVFEKLELWSNYVGALNCVGNALVKLGRLDEARREYARALRRLSRVQHSSWLPFIRKGLAEILFSAERYRESAIAASQAARLYGSSGQLSRSAMARLFEVESWARAGDLTRARHRLELFHSEISKRSVLDPTLESLIASALSGSSPDFQMLAKLRARAATTLDERLGEMPA